MKKVATVTKQDGVSLLEAVIASALVGILAVIGSNFISDSVVLSKRNAAQNTNATAARYAMDRLSREIREMGIGTDGVRQISTMTQQTLVFISASTQAEIGVINKTRTEFAYNSSTRTLLMRQGDSASTPILNNVASFGFSYYDKFGNVTTSAKYLQSIGIDAQTSDADSPAISARTRVLLRN